MPLKMYNPNGTVQTWEDGIMQPKVMTNTKDGPHAENFRCEELKCEPMPVQERFDHQSERPSLTIDEQVKRIFPLMPHEVGYKAMEPVSTPEADVKSPTHYNYGGIEAIDYIKAKLSPEEFSGYCWGNVLKYISRFNKKDGVKDLRKAKVYLDWLVDAYEKRLIFPHKVVE